jgi:hypothetical protein
MKYPKRSQYKYAKTRYRIGNWPEYEAGLRRRGPHRLAFKRCNQLLEGSSIDIALMYSYNKSVRVATDATDCLDATA